MSSAERIRYARGSLWEGYTRVLHACFRDRVGVLLFIGALLFFALTWRLEPILNDSYTVLDAFLSVSDGNLHITNLTWSAPTGSPGLHAVNNRLYGRNYGQIFLALPFYWVLKSASVVADLRILLIAAWAVLLIVFIDQIGAVRDRRSLYGPLGAALGVVLFGANVGFATTLDPALTSLVAVQLSTMTAAALVGVIVYRFVTHAYNRRTGVAAGLAVVLASPVGFWSLFPKRHSLTALAALLVLFSLYRSRLSEHPSEALRFRALSYACVGLFAWVHAPEAFLLLVGLGLVDVVTTRTNSIRHLMLLGGVFLISLLPFLLTNYLISGNPMAPPRTLPSPGGGWSLVNGVFVVTEGGTLGSQGEVSVGGHASSGTISTVAAVFAAFLSHIMGSLSMMTNLDQFYHTFVRSGYVEAVATRDRNIAMRLSMLESMPAMGGLAAIPILAYRRFATNGGRRADRQDPLFATDLLACVLAVLFLVTYWPRLPIHASMTVRYLHPLYPLGVYGLVRIPSVRSVLSHQSRVLAWTYASCVLIGGQVLVALIATIRPTIGEAVQLHAQLSLFAAALVVIWVLVASRDGGYERYGAVALGLATAMATLYLLLSGLIYFSFTFNYGLPISRVVAEALQVLDGPVSFSG